MNLGKLLFMHVLLDVLGDQVNFSWFHDFVRQGLELAKDFGARRDAGRVVEVDPSRSDSALNASSKLIWAMEVLLH